MENSIQSENMQLCHYYTVKSNGGNETKHSTLASALKKIEELVLKGHRIGFVGTMDVRIIKLYESRPPDIGTSSSVGSHGL